MAAYGRLPSGFELNVGQTDARVRFLARSPGSAVFFTAHEAVITLSGARRSRERVLRMRFLGAAHPVVSGVDRLPGSTNYFLGRDRSRRHVGAPTFQRVRYAHLWPGVDATFYGRGSRLEYDFEVAAGADPSRIALRFVGARKARLDAMGALVLTLPGGTRVRELAPVAYQRVGRMRRGVRSRFVLSAGVARVALGTYDHGRPVTVDPALAYSTYLGGSGQDLGNSIAVDAAGSAYVTGFTFSANFPIQGQQQPTNGGGQDAFVAKLNAAGSALVYSTYLGGSGNDIGHGVAVDSAGNVYVAGSTTSTDFPTRTPGQPAIGGSEDAFVAKLNAAGGLVYSTYLGGSGGDLANAIGVGATGEVYLTGVTNSTDFPTRNSLQSTGGGGNDAFLAKLDAAGSALVYSTYLGGSGNDAGFAVAVDPIGEAYVTGSTVSANFPTLSAAQPSCGDSGCSLGDAFVTKLNSAGGLGYSTYLGASATDSASGIAVDSAGNAYVGGSTKSPDFPTRGAAQPSCGDSGCSLGDAFVTKLDSAGGLNYSTYLGGSGGDQGNAIAVDATGGAYVTGATLSPNFPTQSAEQLTPGGNRDAFVTRINPAGDGLVYSTYLGGVGQDSGYGIGVDPAGDAFVTGSTMSPDLPTRSAVQPSCAGADLCLNGDAFVTKLPFDATAPTSTAAIPACHGPVTVTVADGPGGSGAAGVEFRLDGAGQQTLATAGDPSTAAIPIPEGNHTVEYWGADAAGNQEFPHHVASVQVDSTPPSLSITSDQGFLAYEVGDLGSVTIAAADATSGLVRNPSASHVRISTARPGRLTLTRSASDGCGNGAPASFTYRVIARPVLAVSVDVEPVSGAVRIRKGRRYVRLTEARAIPVGSTLDTTRGTVRLTAATLTRGRYQTGKFGGSQFTVVQRRSHSGVASLRLIDQRQQRCTRPGRATVARLPTYVLAVLHSNAHGRFRTRGRYSAATVRGTAWTMEDRCDGTLTVVKRGTVSVFDFRRRRTVAVHAGHRYLARAR